MRVESVHTDALPGFQPSPRNACRKDKIVGSNMYPDLKGKKLASHAPECKAAEVAAAAYPTAQPAAVTQSATAAMVTEAIAAARRGGVNIPMLKG